MSYIHEETCSQIFQLILLLAFVQGSQPIREIIENCLTFSSQGKVREFETNAANQGKVREFWLAQKSKVVSHSSRQQHRRHMKLEMSWNNYHGILRLHQGILFSWNAGNPVVSYIGFAVYFVTKFAWATIILEFLNINIQLLQIILLNKWICKTYLRNKHIVPWGFYWYKSNQLP